MGAGSLDTTICGMWSIASGWRSRGIRIAGSSCEVVEECLDVVPDDEANVRRHTCTLCPAQETANFAHIVLDRLRSHRGLEFVLEPFQQPLSTYPCPHHSFRGTRPVQAVYNSFAFYLPAWLMQMVTSRPLLSMVGLSGRYQELLA